MICHFWYCLVDWFKRHVNQCWVILCLGVRESCSLNIFIFIFCAVVLFLLLYFVCFVFGFVFFLFCFFFRTVIWFQIFLSNRNNYIVWSNYFCSGTVMRFQVRRCSWCNGYRRRRPEFKSRTCLFTFPMADTLGKICIQIFSLQLWVNSMTEWALQP